MIRRLAPIGLRLITDSKWLRRQQGIAIGSGLLSSINDSFSLSEDQLYKKLFDLVISFFQFIFDQSSVIAFNSLLLFLVANDTCSYITRISLWR